MKKITSILVLFTALVFAQSATAQEKIKSNDGVYPSASFSDPITKRVESQRFKKGEYCGWFNHINAISTLVNLKSYVSFLTTDSTSKMVSSDGTSYFNGWHLAGVTLDPKEENFTNVTDGVNLSKFNPYKVDSVYFRYLYVRKLDSAMVGLTKVKVVDTLIVKFYNPINMKYSTFGNPVEKYGVPNNFTRALGGGSSSVYTEKIPLTDNDSTTVTAEGWRSKGFLVSIPPNVASAPAAEDKNAVAFSIFFKQMIQNNHGDTFETRNGSKIKNVMNYFGYSLYMNEDQGNQINQDVYHNNAFYTLNKQLYGGTVNGWANYIPGNAYYQARYVNAAFHLCTPNLKVTDINKNGYGLGNISPNPSKINSDINIEFSLGDAETAFITISDILGNEIKRSEIQKYSAGHNVITMNTSNLKPGIYFYTLNTGNFKASRKFNIVN
ncbi:MAG: T9SS type A sorting domain-containing protein [Bacteroidia bacterium]|nr:T9SS type A sorting domain-containing protein [Bacteroidia bacterium]